MIKYPKIKRLSTLNIIHHQGFDYEFNSFRTDFVGEGGSGKSLISDLLQLIFVGTGAFHSPTQSADERLPKTMVLKTEGRGTDFGYAFLNIEVEENQFVVIGIYLESTGASQMFIIQNGNDFSEETKLIPFNKLIGVNDFIDKNKTLPIDQLKEHIFNTLEYTCASWSTTGKYHKILCNNENNIIPVDVSKNEKVLKNYSKIIQAFSRESLDISKSDKLKNFLFGDEAEKQFEKQFQEAITDLSSDVAEFKDNSDEIEKLKNKHTDLVDLLKKKDEKEELNKEFLLSNFTYLNNLLVSTKKEIINTLNNFYTSESNLSFLKTIAESKVEKLTNALTSIETDFQDAYRKKEELYKEETKTKKFMEWLQLLNCGKDEILNKYTNYHKSKEQIDKINLLKKELKSKDLLHFFESRTWDNDIVFKLQKDYEAIIQDIEDKERLNSINDIENKKSLAYWALNLERKLSIEEESVLTKYQDILIVDKPENIDNKYIPEPKELFDNLSIHKNLENGFWINLNGIIEFIPSVNPPIFNTLKKDEIKEFFKNQSITLSDEIKKLKARSEKLKGLVAIFNNFENPKEYIIAWNSKNTFNDTEDYEFYRIDLKELNEYVSLFEKSTIISNNYAIAKKKFNDVDSKRSILQTLKTNLEGQLEDFPKVDYPQNLDELEKKFEYEKGVLNDSDQLLHKLSNSENYFKIFQDLLKSQTKHSSPNNLLIELVNKINDFEGELKEVSDNYLAEFEKDINNEINLVRELNESKIKELQEELTKKRNAYIIFYNTVAGRYMENNYSRYEGSGDFFGLCEEILPPEIFKDGETLDRSIIEKIDKRLKDINLKNQELNGRKLQRLNTIIDEVNAEVSRQLDYVRRIRNFLNDDDKLITGNHKAYLKDETNKSYPRMWMQDFVDKINQESSLGIGSNLLDDLKPFSKGLEKYAALEEKMVQAFHRCGGPKYSRPSYKQLLNPKSYYDLSFTIESNRGKNAGSTSQTYSAIALLCIARLSLIENDRSSLKKIKPGIRFMPIDEAEGLGSNFDMLYEIAKNNDYQLLSLSILPNKVNKENQNIYLLQNNLEEEKKVNYPPIPVFISSN
ncbi:DNA repair protein Rad50 [Gelatiniphilus marinus]|uniref:DNA repair protein Rad50 n=1 Tax=Gelatiniphilus marinus TaxID=1759464 RepID=A0ABW5JSS5_9FLAO